MQRLVQAVLERAGHETARELDDVAGAIGAARAIAVLMFIGRYATHAFFVNTLAPAPPVSLSFSFCILHFAFDV